jgi:hypothetical protein
LERKFNHFLKRERDSSEEDFHRMQACLYFSAWEAYEKNKGNPVRKIEIVDTN